MNVTTDIPYDLLYYNRKDGKATLLLKEYAESKDNYFLPSSKHRILTNKQRLLNGIKQKVNGFSILSKWFTLHTTVGKIDCCLRMNAYSYQVEKFFKDGMCIKFEGIYPNITCRLYTPNKLICESGKAYNLTDKLVTNI